MFQNLAQKRKEKLNRKALKDDELQVTSIYIVGRKILIGLVLCFPASGVGVLKLWYHGKVSLSCLQINILLSAFRPAVIIINVWF